MGFEKLENGNIVFYNDTERFTFVDMGSYVGHQSREWYEKVPSCWRLMFYDEQKDDSPIHIEALVDRTGYYLRIIVSQGNVRRVLLMNRNVVDEDMIYEYDSEEFMFPKKVYIAFEDKYREQRHPNLQTYLSQEHRFISNDGEVYNGNVSSNSHINNFFESNIELSKRIDNQDIARQR